MAQPIYRPTLNQPILYLGDAIQVMSYDNGTQVVSVTPTTTFTLPNKIGRAHV